MKHLILNIKRTFLSASKSWYLILLILICFSCFPQETEENVTVNGLKPIYMNEADARKIEVLSPKSLTNPGKIYTYGSTLFINELNAGIHVINNSNPQNPVPSKFIKILGNVDIAVKDNILYADNAGDLIALNISDLNNIQLSSRVKDVFPSNNFPSQADVYFECVDPSKGMVVGWEETILETITCRR